jgi:hypothetical protein
MESLMRSTWMGFGITPETKNLIWDMRQKLTDYEYIPFRYMLYGDIQMPVFELGDCPKKENSEKIYGAFQIIDDHCRDLQGEFIFESLEYFPPSNPDRVVAKFNTTEKVIQIVNVIKQKIEEITGIHGFGFEIYPYVTVGILNIKRNEIDDFVKTHPLDLGTLDKDIRFWITYPYPLHMFDLHV